MRDELLALLEEGPQSMADLIGWLCCSEDVIEVALASVGAKPCTREDCRRWFIPRGTAAGKFCNRACDERQRTDTRTANEQRDIDIALKRRPTSAHRKSLDESLRREVTQPIAAPGTYRPARGQGGRLARQNAAAKVDELLGIREPSSGTALCLHCFNRFTPDREGEEFCSGRCREQGPAWAPSTRTIVVNGQEFEATSPGART